MARFALAAFMLYGPFLWCVLRRESPQRYGLTWRWDPALVRSVLFWCGFTLIPLTGVAWFWPTGGIPRTIPWGGVGQLVMAGTTAAIVEEIFFRGWVQSSLRPWVGTMGRVVLVAALFAASHMIFQSRPLCLATFFPGLIMGYLRERPDTVSAPLLYHALCNVWAVWFFPNP